MNVNPQAAFEILKANVLKTIASRIPFEGREQKLVLNKIWADDNLDINDLHSQADAKDHDKTWGVPIRADISLVNKATGKVVDNHTITVARLPKMTPRLGYIVDGNEIQVDHLFRLKPGVYARVQENGDLTSQFNLPAGHRFSISLDRKSKQFLLNKKSSKIKLYPILHALGVEDREIEETWGKELFEANKPKTPKEYVGALSKFFERTSYDPEESAPQDIKGLQQHVRDYFAQTKLLPDTTAITLGKPFTTVNGEAIKLATGKLLGVSRGTERPDDRDSLAFKEVVSAEDFLPEKIQNSERSIRHKIRQTIDHKKSVIEIISTDLFGKPVKEFFSKGKTVAERSEQNNPLQMITAHHKTTLMAPDFGGMKSEHTLTDEMRVINPSHFGFVDPMHTPEGPRTGITLHLNLAAQKKGSELVTSVYDLEDKKLKQLTAAEFHNVSAILPDQVRWEKGHPKPISAQVKMKKPGGDIVTDKASSARYVMPSSKSVFGMASNLIPFLPTDQGNRVSMADKQLEQAISLKDRQEPLVQSLNDHGKTFEEDVGRFSATVAPVAGKVVEVKKDAIVLQDGRKKHEVHLYHHFPLNNPTQMLHSTPLVKVGDQVKQGQLIADSNFTRNGKSALGTNLQVGYLPYKGYNFEDGIVISETASKKLTSEHLHRQSLEIDPDIDSVSKTKWQIHTLRSKDVPRSHIDALDDEGVIKPGTKIEPGQVLVAALRKNVSKTSRSPQPYKDRSLTWDSDHAGEVVKVVKHPIGKEVKVYVRTDEQLVVGDKLTGRHGNKGIVTMILPDHEMPYTIDPKTGENRPLEVLLNPSGVPTRMNIGQMLETAAGKIAEKTGKTYLVNNFGEPDYDYRKHVEDELKQHGLTDEEQVFDPKDPRKAIGSVMVGPQYILKLKHKVDDKLSVRGGGTDLNNRPLPVDVDHQPKRGAENGGKGLSQLDFYVLLGHNARHQLREAATDLSDLRDSGWWSAIQQNQPIPPPKVPFAYEKFMGLLKGAGINVEKQGTKLRLQPLTDREILNMAGGHKGELKNANLALRAKDLKEERHGLFDPVVTGGLEGNRWSFIKLHEPLPNPVFVGHGNQKGPVPTLLGINLKDVDQIMAGEKQIDGKTGGKAIEDALKKINVDEEIKTLKAHISSKPKGSELDRANKKLKYLLALKEVGYTPDEAYVLHYIPVLPPVFRPVTTTDKGDLHYSSLNGLYKNLALTNEKVGQFDRKIHEEEFLHPLRKELYESLKNLQGIGGAVGYDTDSPSGRKSLKGILSIIGGGQRDSGEKEQPKSGYFQSRLMSRRQNLSIRSTIIPEPTLGLDEIGIPRDAAMELYKPFVVAELGKLGVKPLEAQQYMKDPDRHPAAWRALERVIEDRPIRVKRDPTLHKFSIMAFKPKLVDGKAIRIHPLVTGGFNADFDGDTMSGYVPLSRDAVEEAKGMFPSKNLFSPTTGGVMYAPSQEALLGMHLMTQWGKKSGKSFASLEDLKKAHADHQIGLTDVVKVTGAKGDTTLGRLLLADTLPAGFSMNSDLLHKPDFIIKKKSLSQVLQLLAKDHTREFANTVDKLKDLGNHHAFKEGFSFGLKDLVPLPQRDKILTNAKKEADAARQTIKDKDELKEKIIGIYTAATLKLESAAEAHYGANGNRLAQMVYSGARGKPEQLRQMIAAPMLMKDGTGHTLTSPVTRSYSEGLDIGDYWLAQHGARKGTLQRAQGTKDPGTLSKDVVNSTMSTLIVSPDCKTTQGVLMRLTPPKDPKDPDRTHKDVHDRFLATAYKVGNTIIKAGSLITPEVSSQLRAGGHEKVLVRSPLKCEHSDGICAKCFGLSSNGRPHEVGTNIGVLAGQALSEPAVQMAMDSFHTGGIASGVGARSVDKFTRLKQLLGMPKKLKGAATLATVSGKVSDIKKDAVGGFDVYIDGVRHLVQHPNKLLQNVAAGSVIEKGKPISEGVINPRHLLPLSDINRVQKYLTDELYNTIYEEHGVRRRNIEVVVRALTNLTKVKDPGTSDMLHGDVVPRSVVDEHNRNLGKKDRPILHEPILHGAVQVSAGAAAGAGSTDWMSLLNYQRLSNVLTTGAAQGWKTDLHGSHPVPGYAHGVEFGKPPADVKAKKPYVY